MSGPAVSVGDEDSLLRRMAEHWISTDGVIQSVAFFDRRNDLSVDIERLRSIEDIWRETGQRCARLVTGEVRALGCEVLA